jgi:hypothetical protein
MISSLLSRRHLSGSKINGFVDVEILQASQDDFSEIDKLWMQYSNGKFGFSIQKEIWNLFNIDKNQQSDWFMGAMNFSEYVGWSIMDNWIDPNNLRFSINAPVGHLPAIFAPYSYAGSRKLTLKFGGSRRLTLKIFFEHFQADKNLISETLSEKILPRVNEGRNLSILNNSCVNLKKYLQNRDWCAADRETNQLLLEFYDPSHENQNFSSKISQIPPKLVKIINRLWQHYSCDQFSFGIQVSLLLSNFVNPRSLRLAHLSLATQQSLIKSRDRGLKKLGWINESGLIGYPELNFSLNAPVGHLPGFLLYCLLDNQVLSKNDLENNVNSLDLLLCNWNVIQGWAKRLEASRAI